MRRFMIQCSYGFLFMIGLSSCGSAPPNTFSTRQLVCQENGFCLKHNDGQYFYGAFRNDDQELQFKVHYGGWSPTELLIGGDRYAGCLMTEAQKSIYSNSMVCPEDPPEIHPPPLQDHSDISKKFLSYMEASKPVNGRKGEWDMLMSMVRSFANDVD